MRRYRRNQRNQPNTLGHAIGLPEHMRGRVNERNSSFVQDVDHFARDPRLPILSPEIPAAVAVTRPRQNAFNNQPHHQPYTHTHVQQQQQQTPDLWLPEFTMTGRQNLGQTNAAVAASYLAQMREQEHQYRIFLEGFRSPGPQQEYDPPLFSPNFASDPVPEIQAPVPNREIMFAGSRYPNSQLRGDAPEFVPGQPFQGQDQKPKNDRGWMIVTSW